jgi:SAM-dependent methyltransferase
VAFYDLLTAADRSLDGDIELYASLIPAGGAVLELGSGTGRIAHALADTGRSVVGLELSRAMLERAEARRRASPPRGQLRYMLGDMTDLRLRVAFDAVICPFYALAHLEPGEAWARTFAGVARHLKPGALAAFHMPSAQKMAETSPPPPDAPVFKRPDLTLYVAGQKLDASGRYDIDLDYVTEHGRSRERLTLYPGDPTPFAENAGFVVDRPPVALGGTGAVYVYRRP